MDKSIEALDRDCGMIYRLAYFLLKYKQDNGLTFEQMAEHIDVNVTTLKDWVHEKYPPSYKSWQKMIKAFGNPIKDIMYKME